MSGEKNDHQAVKLADLSSPLFRESAKNKKAVIIPFGSMEAHGPHLPLASDTIQAEAVAERVSALTGIPVAPSLPYGVCLSTRDHAGTITITTSTLKRFLADVVRSLRRQGITVFIILSGHAGTTHMAALRDQAETLLFEDKELSIAVISEYDLIREISADIITNADDRHAGEIETSRLLFLAPHLVRGGAPEEYPRRRGWILTRDKVAAWPGSVWGNPGAADADKGRRLLQLSVDAVRSLINDLTKS